MRRDEESNTTSSTHRYFTGKPISYHPILHREFGDWASECGWDPQSLRLASEQAIRSRHHEAIIEHEANKARGNQPDIFTLSLASVDVYYTMEPVEVMIRGYGWEIDHEPLGNLDGGGFYAEASWR